MLRTVADRMSRWTGGLSRPRWAELTCIVLALGCIFWSQRWALERTRAQREGELRRLLLSAAEAPLARASSRVKELTAQARALAGEGVVRGAVQHLLGQPERPETARVRLRDVLNAQRYGFSGFELVDLEGRVVAAAGSSRRGGLAVERTYEVQPLFNAAKGGSGVLRLSPDDPRSPLAAPAIVETASGEPIAVLLLTLDPLEELRRASRDEGERAKISIFSLNHGWIATQSDSRQETSCDESPFDVLDRAGEHAVVEVGRAAVNLDGYRGCSGETLVGAWTSDDDIGVGVLAELSWDEAYQSYTTTRGSLVALGAFLSVALLALALQRRSVWELVLDTTGKPARNTAAWAILGVSLLATAVAWLSALQRVDRYELTLFEADVRRLHDELGGRVQGYVETLQSIAGAAETLGSNDEPARRPLLESLALSNDTTTFPFAGFIAAGPAGQDRRQGFLVGLANLCVDVLSRAPSESRPESCLNDQLAERSGDRALQAAASGELTAAVMGRFESPRGRSSLVFIQPVFEDGMRDAASLAGWLISEMDVDRLVGGVQQAVGSRLGLEIFADESVDSGAPLYDSARSSMSAAGAVDQASRRETLLVAGRRFALSYFQDEKPPLPFTENYPAQVLLAGLAISVLLFDVALVLASTRAKALQIADVMSQRYRHGEARLRTLIDSAPDGILTFDDDGRIQTFNPGAEQVFGYLKAEAATLSAGDLLPICTSRETARLAELEPGKTTACEGSRKDGTKFPAELTVSRTEIDGELTYTAIVRDASSRRQAEERLRESEQRYALAARGANDGLWDWNLQTSAIYYSDRWKAMIGAERQEIGESPHEWLSRIHADDVGGFRQALFDHLEGRSPHFEFEYRIRHSSGGHRWVLCRGIVVRDETGLAARIAGSQTDITERKRAESRLIYDALHDPLTGLPNRTLFMQQLERACEKSANDERYLFGVLFLDLDRFKVVNDSLGHFVGDQMLGAIAERLKRCMRPGDTICRMGGDEFAVLVEGLAGVDDATRLADKIQRELEHPIRAGDTEVFTAVSIGIAMSAGGKQRPEEMLRDADIAMFRAKSSGKARYELFNKKMHTRAVERLQLESDLWRAVKRDELDLYYQPIVSLNDGRIDGCEALIRWRHPSRGVLRPGEFIPIAEESGCIHELTRWMLDKACAQRRAWADVGLPRTRMSVNISPRQLLREGTRKMIDQALSDHGLAPADLQIEITENVLVDRYEAAETFLRELHDLGIGIALDDFGTGYSSLMHLRQFPLNAVKIDRSFIQEIPAGKNEAPIAAGVIALAHGLKLKVVAEGVESAEQMAFLRRHGCDAVQGYWISRPIEGDQLGTLLRRGLSLQALMRNRKAPTAPSESPKSRSTTAS